MGEKKNVKRIGKFMWVIPGLILSIGLISIFAILMQNREEQKITEAWKDELKASLEVKADDTWNYKINDDGITATLTGYKGSEENVIIPEYIDGYKIISISYDMSDSKIEFIKNITISATIKEIGEIGYKAFWMSRNIYAKFTKYKC